MTRLEHAVHVSVAREAFDRAFDIYRSNGDYEAIYRAMETYREDIEEMTRERKKVLDAKEVLQAFYARKGYHIELDEL